ncbi:carbohydrate ABC transporter permease [Paenibacillus sp. GCM10027626]|uniref:carbohydrate ABC transporter permease n=1 Tax=Paenibacillus sp. GCM10027626 TaxID=3273411 RepID=UPI00362E623C
MLLRKGKPLFYGLFLFPGFFLFLLFFMYPNISSFYYSFTNWDGLSPPKFIGTSNYEYLLTDDKFVPALSNTLMYALVVTIFLNLLGLILALALDTGLKSKNILRTIFFAPAVLSMLVVSYIWMRIFDPEGSFNSLLRALHLNHLTELWLGNPSTALYAIAAVNIWQFAGKSMVIFLANLQTIPTELKEAAQLDGANGWKTFRHVTFPLLAPAVTITTVLTAIDALKVFDYVYTMTEGGPAGSTTTVSYFLYVQGLRAGQVGYASAGAVVNFIVVMLVSVVLLGYLRRRENRLR